MLKLNKKQKVILLHRDGVSNRQIAIQTGIHRDTIAKYVNEYDEQLQLVLAADPCADVDVLIETIMEPPHYSTKSRGPKTSTLEATEIIKECLEENARKRQTGRSKQQMKGTDIHLHLIHEGFDISYSTVKKIIQKIKDTSEEAFIKQEYSPGQICEFDWGEVKLNIGGTGYKKYQMAAFASAYGNYRFARLYRSQDTAAFQESHVDFINFCHGVYHTIVYDNMKVAVRRFVGPTEKEPTEALVQMSTYYGFNFRFCNVRSGNEKGHVEKTVDVMRRYAFSGPGNDCFDSLDQANDHLLQKCIEKNLDPLSDGRIPAETFAEEQPFLMAELAKLPCFVNRPNCHVDKYATVTVNNVHYSVPDRYVNKKVTARIYTNRVVLYYDGTPVAAHERCYKHGEYRIDIYHYLKTLQKKPGALPHSTALLQADTQIKTIYENYYTKDSKGFLEVLEIIKELGVDEVAKALSELHNLTPSDLNSEKVRSFCNTKNCINTIGQDRLSKKSKSTLPQYDMLRVLQNTVKEAI